MTSTEPSFAFRTLKDAGDEMAVRYDVTSVEHILAFYVETLPEVIRWARRWGAADDAEDVVHQIVLAMLQRRDTCGTRPTGPISSRPCGPRR